MKVPKEQLVGEVNKGWTIAKRLLQFERQSISASGFGSTSAGAGALGLHDIAMKHVGQRGSGELADGDLRARITKHMMYDQAFGLTIRRGMEEAKAGSNGALTSIAKYCAAKLNQEKTELTVEALGTEGLGWSGEGFDKKALSDTRAMLRAKGNSIEGGTSEVNLNVIAKRVLGLRGHQ